MVGGEGMDNLHKVIRLNLVINNTYFTHSLALTYKQITEHETKNYNFLNSNEYLIKRNQIGSKQNWNKILTVP